MWQFAREIQSQTCLCVQHSPQSEVVAAYWWMSRQEAEAADTQQAPAWGEGERTGIQLQRLLRRLMVEWFCVWVSTCHSLAFAPRAGWPLSALDLFVVPNSGSKRRHCFFTSTRRTKP